MMRITPIGASAVVLTLLTSSVLYLRSRNGTQTRPKLTPKSDEQESTPTPNEGRRKAAAPATKKQPTKRQQVPVYVTERGTRYHREECRTLRGNGRSIPITEARTDYDPCKLCLPPV